MKFSMLDRHQTINLAIAFIAKWCAQEGVEAYHEHRFSLIIEELIANTFEHGAPAENSALELDMSRTGDLVTIFYVDAGSPFNPNEDLAGDDRNKDMEDRRVGGLGWPLIYQLCESVNYVRRDDQNRTTLVRRLNRE